MVKNISFFACLSKESTFFMAAYYTYNKNLKNTKTSLGFETKK